MNNSWVSWWIWVKTVKTIKHRDSIKSGDTIPSIIIYKNHKKRQVLCQLCSVCNLRWNVIATKALVAAETINGGQSWLLQPSSCPFYHNWKVANISLKICFSCVFSVDIHDSSGLALVAGMFFRLETAFSNHPTYPQELWRPLHAPCSAAVKMPRWKSLSVLSATLLIKAWI